jgi:hypothetical protein
MWLILPLVGGMPFTEHCTVSDKHLGERASKKRAGHVGPQSHENESYAFLLGSFYSSTGLGKTENR